MKKLLASFVVLILFVQLAVAGEIFNDEVKDNVPFTINSIEHVARYYPSAGKVSLKAGDDRVLVAKEDCADLGDLKYCIDSVSEGINEETGDPASTMQLRVLQSGPTIEITRSISDDTPNLNEEVTVSATITNSGNERASNVNYEDKYPSSVRVSGAVADLVMNGASWVGSLNPGESQTISYKLKFSDFITYESTAVASFIFNNKVNKVKSSTKEFEVQKPYRISDSISSKSVDVGEEITYIVSINNSDSSQDLRVESFESVLPAGATTSHRSMGLELDDGKVKYSGTIEGSGSEELTFRFKSMKVAEGELVTKVTLKVGSKTFQEEFKHKVGIGVSAIMPEITFNPTTVKGGGELEIEAKITNNGDETVSDISLDMTSDIVDPSGWRHLELEPGKKHYGFNKILSAPAATEEKTYFVKLSGSYQRASGKTMKFEAREELTVLPQEQLVALLPKFKVDGKEVNVTLSVKNVAPYKVTAISLIDTIPKGFKALAGDRYIDIDEMAIGEERVAYSYVVEVPATYTKDTFEIVHIFNGLDKDEEKIMTEKTSAVSLSGAAADETGSEEAPEETAEGNETAGNESGTGTSAEQDEEKPGIFTRMWRWVKGLFSKEPEEEDRFE
ncbi:DUF11 domain-containing protein [Candidatus Woesearchaeota archaeon]|nr:DUF11 domain-containing protein [Candidatus Woesearchaeota archaeon]